MTRQTRHGLTLTLLANGCWGTEDGQYALTRQRAIEFCENPHPMRVGRFGANHSYCPGNNEHDREIGWGLLDRPPRGMSDDVFQTLDEAWRELAAALAN